MSCDTCGKAIPTGHEGLIENDGELHPYCGECETPEEFGGRGGTMSRRKVPTDVLALVDAFVVKVEAWQKLLPTLADLCSRISPSRTLAQQ